MEQVLEILVLGYAVKVWEVMAVLGVLLCVLEVMVPGFVMLPIGLAFCVTALGGLFVSSWLSILLILAVSLMIMIWFFQTQVKKVGAGPVLGTNAEGLLGKELVVTQKVEGLEWGEAKLYGDRWTVYSLSQSTYEVGERVQVVKVDGNKLAID